MLRNVIFIVLLFLTAPSIVGAQEQQARNAGDPLIPTCAFPAALCGYVDREGRTVIESRFDWADRFIEDRAAVRLAGKYGFIDRAGTIVVPLAYDLVGNFSNGRAEVPASPAQGATRLCGDGAFAMSEGGKWGFTDTSGKFFIPPRYDRVACFHRGLAWAAIPERREWCLIDKRGDIADRPCHCGQPLVIIEHWTPRPSISAAACYQAGLDLLGPLRGPSR